MPVSAMLRAPMALAGKLGVKKAAILYSDEPFPAGLADGGRAQAAKNGIEVVLYENIRRGRRISARCCKRPRRPAPMRWCRPRTRAT